MTDQHELLLAKIKQLTAAYREGSLAEGYQQKIAISFAKESIERVLYQEGCRGIRCYFASNSSGTLSLVLTGYDKNGNDLLSEVATPGVSCPPFCSNQNDLNG